MDRVRILIADDQETIRQDLREILESRSDWEVCGEAANGEEAVHRTQELRPDLIILDITMPVLNGLDAARMIRTFSPQTPVLIVTMHKTKQLLEEARRVGVRGYVAKADMGHSLIRAVSAVLENQPFFAVENASQDMSHA